FAVATLRVVHRESDVTRVPWLVHSAVRPILRVRQRAAVPIITDRRRTIHAPLMRKLMRYGLIGHRERIESAQWPAEAGVAVDCASEDPDRVTTIITQRT